MTIYRDSVVLACAAATGAIAGTATGYTLQIGNVPARVQLARQRLLLQSETTELGTVFENKQNLNLPLNGTDDLRLASLANMRDSYYALSVHNNRKVTHKLTVNPGSHSEAKPPVTMNTTIACPPSARPASIIAT